jgi:hypothetical protein
MFPVGIDVARMLKRDGNISKNAKRTLTELFGTKGWDELYATFESQTLSGKKKVTRRQPGCDAIINYFVRRLQSLFKQVVSWPLRLENSRHATMYSLCFASPSKQRAEIATTLFRSTQLSSGRIALPRVSPSGKR